MDQNWIILIYLAGLIAMLIELFIPGAVMGTIGFLAVVGTIVFAFLKGQKLMGTILLVVSVIVFPLFFLLWKNVLGKLWAINADEKGFRATTIEESLAGKEAEALSQLRPSGTALIDGRRYAVVTRGELLEKGTKLRVVEVAGNRILVARL